jgi:hypothetical protein
MYSDYECQVIHKGNLTEVFKVHSGMRQGAILSPTLFLIAMDDIIGILYQNKGRNQIGFAWTFRGSGTQRLFLTAVTELQRHVRENMYLTGSSSHSCFKN